MQSNRKRILTMLENGTITTDEALTLLENISGSQAETLEDTQEPESKSESESKPEPETEKEQKTKEEPADKTETFDQESSKSGSTEKDEQSMEEFLEDLRKDFTNVGDRFMQFMQTAVQKVKEFDFDSPFGQSVTFTHTLTKPVKKIDELILDIANGKVAVYSWDEKEARAEFTVKAYNSESEETAKKSFLEKILFVTDENKLRVSSAMKMTQVNIDLYVPRKTYTKLSARLMNGSFEMKDAEIKNIRVKTANGKIEVSGLLSKDAEFETANGAIRLTGITGETLAAETLNGRVYIDGSLQEVDAQSLSGHVIVTTTNAEARNLSAKTMSGSVELYIPSTASLSGEIASNMGRLDLQLDDVTRTSEQEQLLQRTIRFEKEVADRKIPLHIFGESKTGSVIVCYNATKA